MRTEGGPAPHVFILAGPKRQGALQYFEVVTLQTAGATFRGETEVGRTSDMVVYSDGSAEGNASAQAVLKSAEADFKAVQTWFGGLTLGWWQSLSELTNIRQETQSFVPRMSEQERKRRCTEWNAAVARARLVEIPR